MAKSKYGGKMSHGSDTSHKGKSQSGKYRAPKGDSYSSTVGNPHSPKGGKKGY